MAIKYINPEEFNKQLNEKILSVEAVAELLEIEISIAKNIFSGYKSITNFEILQLHELAGFSYPDLIGKQKTPDPNRKIKSNKTHDSNNNLTKLRDTYLNVYQKANCEGCNFLIFNPINFCPKCGVLLPQTIRKK